MAPTREPGSTTASSGVEQLIARLRDEGVQAGRKEADAIVEDAKTLAETILREADEEAARIVANARKEAEQLETAGKEALRISARDTVLRFQQELMDYFNERVRRLVSEQMEDRDMLGRLILAVAGSAARSAGVHESDELEILLPTDVVGMEDLKRSPDEQKTKLTQLVRSIAGATWREGVTFKALEPEASGIRVRVESKRLEVELTSDAVAGVLLQHMQPRFRALMQGIIQ